ncbi:hypothetical protein GCM10009530_03670 [Microbispora corallina]|uniref:Uncharacterized protein n=1 Tax=Microbispora corallina TaxID=83302 RepID=A0ABQ4FRH2_9ACTN|nr:hypothetical protein [Microbispora corallina]GIH37406.1 hypothetical protein Mco01_04060 [Microbispora corallina]
MDVYDIVVLEPAAIVVAVGGVLLWLAILALAMVRYRPADRHLGRRHPSAPAPQPVDEARNVPSPCEV